METTSFEVEMYYGERWHPFTEHGQPLTFNTKEEAKQWVKSWPRASCKLRVIAIRTTRTEVE